MEKNKRRNAGSEQNFARLHFLFRMKRIEKQTIGTEGASKFSFTT
jgi:hypothetical protein